MNWSTANKTGLVLLGIAAVANLVPIPTPEGEPGPPMAVLIAAAALGVIAVVAVIRAWRSGSRKAALVAIGVSVVNALLAVPAFFVPGVPSELQMLAGIFIGWTVVAVALTLAPRRDRG